MAVGDPFGRDQRVRLDRAVFAATGQTGVRFAVCVGSLIGDDPAEHTERLLAAVAPPEEPAALVFVAPGERLVQIATTAAARERLSDHACGLAALSMTTSFGVGDLVGGMVSGLRMMADAAGRRPFAPPALHSGPLAAELAAEAGSGSAGEPVAHRLPDAPGQH